VSVPILGVIPRDFPVTSGESPVIFQKISVMARNGILMAIGR